MERRAGRPEELLQIAHQMWRGDQSPYQGRHYQLVRPLFDLPATGNLCRALGLLAVGRDWSDRGYSLTDTGQVTALAALRARATGPRTIPWS